MWQYHLIPCSTLFLLPQVELEFSFNSPYGHNDDDDDDLPDDADTMTTLPAYSTDNLDNAHSVPRSYSSDLHDPIISGLEPYGTTELGMPSGDRHTPPLEHLSEVDPASTPTSLHIGESPRGANNSQDIENIMSGGSGGGGVWHSQNSGSQSLDPSSPNLGGRKAEWRTSSDTGYATSKSQESYTQSQPKSQEAAYHTHHTPPSGSDVGALGFGTSDHPPGAGGSDGDSRHGDGYSHPHHRSSVRGTNRMDFGSGSGGGVGPKGIHGNENHHTSSNSHTPSHSKAYLGQRSKEDFSKSYRDPLQPIPQDDAMRFGVGRRQTPPGGTGDSFSPNQSHMSSSHSGAGGPADYPPMGGRGYDGFYGYGYGGYPMPPNEKQRYFDHFKQRRPTSMYGGEPGEFFHPQAGGGPYGSMPGPGGRPMVAPYGGRPPPGGYPDFYNPRGGGGGRYTRPHDPHHPPHLAHAMSHERMDGATPSNYSGRGRRLGGVDEEFPIDMYLSQPTTSYNYNLESPGGYGMPPVMG